jgi:hypothetical protein
MRGPGIPHPLILAAWSRAIHTIINAGRPEDLAQIPPPADEEFVKSWTESILAGDTSIEVPECCDLTNTSSLCWRCAFELAIEDATKSDNEKGRAGDKLASEAPISETTSESKNMPTETLIATHNLSARDALGTENPERITAHLLVATSETGACEGPCQRREYIACLCSLKLDAEGYDHTILAKWAEHNLALRVDMLFWDHYWEFKVRQTQYESCTICHGSYAMMKLPENKRHCVCEWVSSGCKE